MKSLFNYLRRNEDIGEDDDELIMADQASQGHQSLLMNDYLTSGNGNGTGDDYNLSHINSYNHIINNNSNDTNNIQEEPTRKRRLQISKYFLSANVMNILGNLLAVVTLLSFLILVPWITAHAMIHDKARPDFAAFYSAGAFVLITVAMSTKLIYNHLTHWYMPDVQKYVVRILWMVPIYSVQSWLSLRFHNARIYIDTLRDLYEAYVIQSFLYYLMELLGKNYKSEYKLFFFELKD